MAPQRDFALAFAQANQTAIGGVFSAALSVRVPLGPRPLLSQGGLPYGVRTFLNGSVRPAATARETAGESTPKPEGADGKEKMTGENHGRRNTRIHGIYSQDKKKQEKKSCAAKKISPEWTPSFTCFTIRDHPESRKPPSQKAMKSLLLSFAASVVAFSSASADTFTWDQASAGAYDWNTGANWDPNTGFANAIDDVANVNIDIGGNQTITLNEEITVGTLNLGDATGTSNFTISSAASEALVFETSAGNAILAAQGGSNSIGSLIVLNDTLEISNTGGTLTFGTSAADGVSGTGGIILNSGTYNTNQFNASHTYSGGFTLNGGTIGTGTSSTGSNGNPTGGAFGTGRITLNGGNINVRQSNGITIRNKVTVGGDFSFGATNGHIQWNVGNAADAFVLGVDNADINLNTTSSSKLNTISGAISGAVATYGVTFSGDGGLDSRLEMSGSADNTYTGTTTVSSMRLELNKGSSATAIAGNLTIGGTVTDEGRVQLDANNQIANTSTVTVNQFGSFAMGNKNETVAAMNLNGGMLLATGTLTAPVTSTGGIINPGTNAGTLSITGNLATDATSVFEYQLDGTDQSIGGSVNDFMNITGNLTLDGTLNVSELGSFSSATNGDSWRLFDYSGLLVDNGLALGTTPTLTSGLNFEIDTATLGQVNLVVVGIPEPSSSLILLTGIASLLGFRRRRK